MTTALLRPDAPTQLTLGLAQRWNRGRESYRKDRDTINPRIHGAEALDREDARRFLVAHHYAGEDSYPATQVEVGMFRATGLGAPQLVGAAVLGIPSSGSSITRWTGLAPDEGVVLQRFALLDHVEAFGETWFLSRVFNILRERLPTVKAVVSYSDPVARVNAQGIEYKPGHIGHIYKAFSGCYRGRTRRDDTYLAPGGEVMAPRSMSKLRNSERGRGGVERRLLKYGAPPRLAGELDRAYAYRLVEEGFLRRLRRPGNHVYTWPLVYGGERRRLVASWKILPPPTEPDDLVLGPADWPPARAA
jgi:hypothetical protein